MEEVRKRVQALAARRAAAAGTRPAIAAPTALKGATLRGYQLQGVAWLADNYEQGINGVLADEMGLGKTLQTIAFFLLLQERTPAARGPFLVVCPLSLVENWRAELERFAPSLGTLVYVGDKDARAALRDGIVAFVNGLPAAERADPPFAFKVVVTTYEACNTDFEFLRQFRWRYLVVDEAARLKNAESLLYQTLRTLNVPHCCLLTGTPVQNNLTELHALLSFGAPTLFGNRDQFVNYFAGVADAPPTAAAAAATGSRVAELHEMIRPFLLRRIKEDVLGDLPPKREITVYAALTPLQRHLYRALLVKDLAAFETQQKKGLNNLLVQLRKCVNHPYLFDGVEPEPFHLGDHLVHASGKLLVLDRLLALLRRRGSRVLIFSQMTRMLDILQDYLQLRKYSYERLDGSVRGEERNLAVKNFTDDASTFIFLLSTRAGGVGLNLTASDTVIFVDSDFNPQADLQAAARVHRIGQTKPVTIIRLLCRDTVEDVIMRRAAHKLRLSQAVMAGTDVPDADDAAAARRAEPTTAELISALKFGLHRMLDLTDAGADASTDDVGALRKRAAALTLAPEPGELAALDRDLERTLNGAASPADADADAQAAAEAEVEAEAEADLGGGGAAAASMDAGGAKSIYVFNGEDYTDAAKERARQDQSALDKLLAHARATDPAMAALRKPAKVLTPEERRERAEAAAKRAEERRVEQQRQRDQHRLQAWADANYTSASLPAPPADGEEDDRDSNEAADGEQDEDGGRAQLEFVDGDVTAPVRRGHPGAPVVIVHCVDASGRWGRGGVFAALDRLDASVGERYEAAGDAGDLRLGDVHLLKLTVPPGRDAVALVVAQSRDRSGQLSPVQLPALETALEKISRYARSQGATVHLPRIGQGSAGFDWYRTERCIRKCLTARGVPTYVYYYIRRRDPPAATRSGASSSAGSGTAAPTAIDPPTSGAPGRTAPTSAPPTAAVVDDDATDEDDAATDPDPPSSPATAVGSPGAGAGDGSVTDQDESATVPDDVAVAVPPGLNTLFADLSEVESGGDASGDDETQRDDVDGPSTAPKRKAESPVPVDEDDGATQEDAPPPPARRARVDVDDHAAAAEAAGPPANAPALLDLFTGCQVWFASPNAMLVRLATFYDADVMVDFDAELVTHAIVPDDLAAALQAIEDRRRDGSLPTPTDPALRFVRDSWISESAAAGRRLPVDPYCLA